MTKSTKKEHETEETLPAIKQADNKSLTTAGLSLDDLALDAGHGMQNVAPTDLATPLLYILQSNSPQVKRSDGKYISGAIEGQIFNNVSTERFDGVEGIVVIPCFFRKDYVEWKPKRGGLVAIHASDTPLRDQVTIRVDEQGKQIPTLPNGNALIETNNHYVLIVHASGGLEPTIIPMVSTALKASRTWNSLMKKVVLQDSAGKSFTPASYYMTYKLTTKARTRDQFSWFTWNIEPNGPVTSREAYEMGKAFEKAVSSGKVKAKLDDAAQPESQPSTGHADPEDDSIPF